SISRANLDGSGVEPSFVPIPQPYSPSGLAADAGHVYWADYRAIGRANLDGTGVEPSFIAVSSQAVAVDANHVYFSLSDYSSGTPTYTMRRAALDGSTIDPNFEIVSASPIVDITVDAGYIYWVSNEVYEMPPH